ncbi:MAG: outer membrane beta-barrel protein [Polyangiaceae bacterium]|nr:outer membrane beta-barrel protein [Polyangiaceae bacterium]
MLKTYSLDMPADFTGGSVRLNTCQMPTRFIFSASAISGFNSQSTFRSRPTYPGGTTNWLGTDDGGRKLPARIGPTRVDNQNPADNEAKAESLSQQGRRLQESFTPPHTTLSLVVGNQHQIAERPLRWLVAASYGRRYDRHSETQALYLLDADSLQPKFKFDGTRSTEVITLSTLGTLTYQIAQGHRLGFTGLLACRTDDETPQLQGFEQERNIIQALSTARWVERMLTFGQLVGEHRIQEPELRWQFFAGRARRDEPNFLTVYETPPKRISTARLDDGTNHFFASQREDLKGGGLDYDLPIDRDKTIKIKVGGMGQWKDRIFGSKRFRFQQQRGAGCAEVLLLPINQLLSPANAGQCMLLGENTNPTDAYTADQRVLAAYLMSDVSLSKRVRLSIGSRLEDGRLSLISRDPFNPQAPPVEGGYQQTDMLPATSIVLSLGDRSHLRLAATCTVARPQLQEVVPFALFQDFFNAIRIRGNPRLDRSKITNLDLRYEFFPTADEVVAGSIFYKSFEKPIC